MLLEVFLLLGWFIALVMYATWRFLGLVDVGERRRHGLPVEDLLRESTPRFLIAWAFTSYFGLAIVIATVVNLFFDGAIALSTGVFTVGIIVCWILVFGIGLLVHLSRPDLPDLHELIPDPDAGPGEGPDAADD